MDAAFTLTPYGASIFAVRENVTHISHTLFQEARHGHVRKGSGRGRMLVK